MRHEDRRKELGKMLMDIAKYLATVGFISNLLAEGKINIVVSASIVTTVILLVTIAFYTIPPKIRRYEMIGFYIILAGVIIIAIFAFVVSYIEDHPKKFHKREI